MMTRTISECKSILFKLGIKHGVSPKLISERLLSKKDKEDMVQGVISLDMLDCLVATWKEDGLRNYVEESGELYSDFVVTPTGCTG